MVRSARVDNKQPDDLEILALLAQETERLMIVVNTIKPLVVPMRWVPLMFLVLVVVDIVILLKLG